jgi:hypothetical protein
VRKSARGARIGVAAAVVGALSLSACSSTPAGGGSAKHTTPPGEPLVAFVQGAAVAANGPIPTDRSAKLNCGSAKYGWLSELAQGVSITQATVGAHWGAFVPAGPAGPGGKPVMAKQMMASGTIASPSNGPTDVPFDHPYGGDESFDEKLAPAYKGLDQSFPAPGNTGYPADTIHDEIQIGLVPHVPGTDQISAGESWPDAATADDSNVAPGFTPQSGDAAAVMGSWVTDCGHQDFHPELHTVSFMAYGHRVGDATVAHAFYNPYEVAQLYNPDTSISGKVNDDARLTSPSTGNVLHYVVTAVTRLAAGLDQAATVPQLLVPFTTSPAPWLVCAPAGTSGATLKVSYDFSVRPGVTVSVVSAPSTGCATVTSELTSSYTPADAPGQRECPTSWSWLNTNAFGQGGTGHVDIPQLILQYVRKISPSLAAALAPKVNAPLVSNCYPPLTVSGLSSPGAAVQRVTTSLSQVLPLAGWVQVSWGA